MWNRIKRAIKVRLIKRWGSASAKKLLWDQEFASGQWDYLERTSSDPVYAYLEKYSDGGSILDLGCGCGNTSNELNYSKYENYTGIDVSEVAIRKAEVRSRENQRGAKNEYVCSDIESYVPTNKYDVVLFRESIFYVPVSRIKTVLDRYIGYLKPQGVLIVRMCDRERYKAIVAMIAKSYSVVDKHAVANAKGIILVFRRLALLPIVNPFTLDIEYFLDTLYLLCA